MIRIVGSGYSMITNRRFHSVLATWRSRVVYSVVDQGLYSGANFVLNIMLMRLLSGVGFGQFALTFATFLLLAGIHNSILLEPLGVLGSTVAGRHFSDYVSHLYVLHFGVCGVISLAIATGALLVPSPELSRTLLSMACAVPVMLLAWVTRRLSYVVSRPDIAAAGSGTYCLVLLSLVVMADELNRLSAGPAFTLMAISSLASAAVMLKLLPVTPRFAFDGIRIASLRAAFIEQWSIGKWVALQTAFTLGATHLPIFIIGLMAGAGDAGVLRALELVILPIHQIMTVLGGMLALPVLSRDYSLGHIAQARHKVLLISTGLTTASIAYLLMLIAMSEPVAEFLGGSTDQVPPWLIPLCGLVPVAAAVGSGAGIALRAAQKTMYYPLSTGVPGMVGLIATPLLIARWEIVGGIISMILMSLVVTVLSITLYHRWLGSTHD